MRITVLTTVHPSDDIRIYHKESKSLAKYYDISLIAPGKNTVAFDDIRYYPLSTSSSRFSRLLLQREAYRILKRTKPDVVHMHDPELLFLALLAKSKGYKVVWDVHEDLPGQILSKPWIPKVLRTAVSTIAKTMEKVAGQRFDRIVTVTSSIARHYPKKKTVIVQNFPIVGELTSEFSDRQGRTVSMFVHAGGLTRIRGIAPLISAFAVANEQSGQEVKLLLIGKFESKSFEDECRASPGWKYVEYHAWVDRKRLAELLAKADAGIVTFLPVPNHTSSQPNKIFEYMSIGLPLIVSDFPLWRELVADRGSGLMVDPDSPQAIAEAIVWLLKHPTEAQAMGERGRQAVLTEFNWDAEFKKLLAMYRELENE